MATYTITVWCVIRYISLLTGFQKYKKPYQINILSFFGLYIMCECQLFWYNPQSHEMIHHNAVVIYCPFYLVLCAKILDNPIFDLHYCVF